MTNSIDYTLEQFNGDWTEKTAAHLLRRTLFGPKLSEINQVKALGLSPALDLILAETSKAPTFPLNYNFDSDPNSSIGTTWINSPFLSGMDFWRKNSYRGWTIETFINQDMNIQEKMTLFWINHFVAEMDIVGDSRGTYELVNLLRTNSTGNFQKLVEDVTVSQAMLIYLNGNTNRNGSPNENYARELLELFTIGKGPLIGEGNYTNYTEEDIQEAARVLSGYVTSKNPMNTAEYRSFRHDKGQKQFSAIFNNRIINNEEGEEYKTLIQMIFDKEETSKYLCRKLYRWFVYYEINDEVETNIIEPLAKILRDNNYLVKPVLRKLLGSKHFYDQNFVGAQIKSPIDFNIGFIRQLEVDFPDNSSILAKYNLLIQVFNSAKVQLQSISDPPDVAGWKAYYQEPAYYRSWISSVTLTERNNFTDRLLTSNGISRNGESISVDPIKVLDQVNQPQDVNEVINTFSSLLLPVEISTEAKSELKEVLIPGLPDFEWTIEYNLYKSDPNNEEKKKSIQRKLLSLISSIKNLPAIQLA